MQQTNHYSVLERVRELDEKATGGPWHYGTVSKSRINIAADFPKEWEWVDGLAGNQRHIAQIERFGDEDQANAELVIESRTLMPLLAQALMVAVEEIERIKRKNVIVDVPDPDRQLQKMAHSICAS